jgi:ubiquinone/menaquinone biosynthesis C-methylase UbiE
MSSPTSKNENVYFVDVENTAERERLTRQGRFLQAGLQGHLPEQMPTPGTSGTLDILDIACGDGAWVLDVARAYPQATVTGGDLSRTAVAFAQERAEAQGISNARFRVLDALKPFDIPDNSFDLVNARLVYGFIPPATWSSFIQECQRIVRPGGLLRITEGEFGLSNGAATEKLASLSASTMQRMGNSFSPDGRHTGITPMLWLFLRDVGFQDIQKKAYVIEYLGDRDAEGDLYHNLLALYNLLKFPFIKSGVVSQEEFDALYDRFTQEMQSRDFCQIWYYLTVWGQKPSTKA